ncbi:peptidoglycan-binding protein [Panacagrimonas sp.]|uniref:peptidoglycan-binding protein n=1 Tax=Panacagrimonas sp. TaxID=2480088 RepID=UPI003B51B5AF
MVTTAPLWSYGQDIAFTRPTRSVHTVYLHCSASDVASHDDVSVIKAWHLERNFGDIGYHYFINKNGNVQAGRALESIPIAQAPHNTGSIAICCHGLAEASFTAEQYTTVIKLCTAIRDAYSPSQIRFRGHCEVSTKTCPVYHYRSVLGLNANGYMTGSTTITPPLSTPPPAAGAGSARATTGATRMLDRGPPVLVVKNLLRWNGIAVNAQTDLFDQATFEAVLSFQRLAGIDVDGQVGPQTRTALSAGGNRARLLKLGTQGEDVRALQRLLGLHQIVVSENGRFDVDTGGGVVSFQRRKGLVADGVAGAMTRAAFFK